MRRGGCAELESEIERGPEMRALTRLVAARSGQFLIPGTLANELDLSQPTVKRYLSLLEEVFLIKRIPAWSRNLRARAPCRDCDTSLPAERSAPERSQ